jgi:hypothetical protein
MPTPGWLSPLDTTRATSARPAFVPTGANAETYYDPTKKTKIRAQDLNNILGALRYCRQQAGLADNEGDDTLLWQSFLTLISTRLAADTTYYVRSDGNDANTGLTNTAGGAFATKQHAINVAAALDLNGHNLTIQVGAGADTTGTVVVNYEFNNGNVTLLGDTTTPSNCPINTAGQAVTVNRGALSIGGFKITTSSGGGLLAQDDGKIALTGAMEYGAVASRHIIVARGGQIFFNPNINYTISGGAISHIQAANGELQYGSNVIITLTGTPAFSTAFIDADRDSSIDLGTSLTFSGAATGPRFLVHSTVNLRSGSVTYVDWDTFLPGDVKGQVKQNFFSITGYKNILVNGSGRLTGGPSGAVANDVYGLHDRWYALTQTGTVTPITVTDVEDGIPHIMRITNTTGSAQRAGYAQIIEGRECKHLRGKTVTLTAKVRRNDANAIRVSILEWTGTEDAVTSDIILSWTSTTFTPGNFFAATSLNVVSSAQISPGTSVIGNLMLRGVVLGTSFTNLIIFVHARDTLTATTGNMDFRLQLEEGADYTPFERRPIVFDHTMALRYRRRKAVQTQNGARHIPLIPPMRVAPTVTSDVGTPSSATVDGFELTHTAVATATIDANAEL